MANEFYITAGLIAQDIALSPGVNAFYITAGLVADDYTVEEVVINALNFGQVF